MTIYSDPASFGLEVIAEIDKSSGYDFDLHVLFRNADGAWFMGSDSGFSCPRPFEDQGISDLTRVLNSSDVVEYLQKRDGVHWTGISELASHLGAS